MCGGGPEIDATMDSDAGDATLSDAAVSDTTWPSQDVLGGDSALLDSAAA